MSRIIGRDCDCEDFPCCGHGITENDQQAEREWMEYDRMFEDDRDIEDYPEGDDIDHNCDGFYGDETTEDYE